MSDLLSQAEIDALLNGIPGDGEGATPEPPEAEQVEPSANEAVAPDVGGYDLSSQEVDVLGEIGNISMGAAATTLSTLINQTVMITTPQVSVMAWKELTEQYPKPYIVTKVEYTEGLMGTNLLIMNVDDIRILTNLMMSEDPRANPDAEISELQLSAISEAMNQMIGSSCTAVSSMVTKKIDITPPVASYVDLSSEEGDIYSKLYENAKVVKIAFRMVVGDLIDSELMQLLPLTFARDLVKSMFDSQDADATTRAHVEVAPHAPAPPPPQQPQIQQSQPMSAPQQAPIQMEAQNMYYQAPEPAPRTPVNVQPVQFQSLDDMQYSAYKENIGLIMDVPLQVTVELGRASRVIREILEFGPGSIVELDKLAGEPVDILVNGKIIAKGEVVVIDESFGVRITDIVHPSKRI